MATSTSAMATTGVPSMMTILVAYIDQRNKGSRCQVSPGARMRWIVTMKFSAVMIDEKPMIRAASAADMTWVCEARVLSGV
jgi:hypothetical protein